MELPPFYNLYFSKIKKDKMIFSSNLLLLQQRLIIDKASRHISYEYAFLWKRIYWKKHFDEFSRVECRLERAGRNRRNMALWYTNLILKSGDKIPLKGSFFEIIRSQKETDFSRGIAEYIGIPYDEFYGFY